MNPLRLLLATALAAASSAFAPTAFVQRVAPAPTQRSALYMVQGQGDFYKKVFVAGGSKGVGRLVVDKLVSNGAEVVALVRSDEAVDELSALDGVTAIKGDAMDYKTVEGAMDGCDAAITTLGGGHNVAEGEKYVDYVGNNNVIEAAGILGVTRVVLVTSVGCGSSKEATPPSVYEVLKDVLVQKEKAEKVLTRYYTNMNWTIVRPGGLVSEPPTGKAVLTEDTMAIGSIHRGDVADLVVKALSSKNTEKKILSAVDPSIESASNPEGKTCEAFILA
jgi:nucleoside-diphosphate-sugar epimerase